MKFTRALLSIGRNRSWLLQVRILGEIVLKEAGTDIHGSYRDAIGVLTGSDPLPGRIDLGACEVAGLGLKNGGSSEDHRDYFFPFVGADHRHARDVVGIFLQKAHFIPAGFPIRAFHLGEVGEDADGALFPLGNDEFNLRLKCFDFVGGNPSDYFETDRRSVALVESFNHGRASPYFLLEFNLKLARSIVLMGAPSRADYLRSGDISAGTGLCLVSLGSRPTLRCNEFHRYEQGYMILMSFLRRRNHKDRRRNLWQANRRSGRTDGPEPTGLQRLQK